MFIPEITVEMFRNGCLESIEALMAEGEVYDIEYDPKSAELKPEWIPCSERLPKVGVNVLVCDIDNDIYLTHMSPYKSFYDEFCDYIKNVKAWMPLPEPWKGEEE